MRGTNDVIERESRWFLSRSKLGAIILCILAFGVSSGFPNRTLNHWVSTVIGVAVLLFGLAPALREISDEVQEWAAVGGSLVLGAGLGLFFRLIMR